jgi:hypothetical protein
MPGSERKRQEKLARKAAKRKQHVQALKRAEAEQGPLSVRRAMSLVASAPIHECLAPVELFGRGIGTVVVSRKLPNGQLAVGSFLLDVWCLGVKNAFCRVLDPDEYRELRQRVSEREHMRETEPACARKLVESAEAYAQDLGFSPHPDYAFARQIFGDLDAGACPSRYEFGKDGKPFYVSGPYDTPVKSRRIVETLAARCGEGNFHYTVFLGGPEELGLGDEGEWDEEADDEEEVIEGESVTEDITVESQHPGAEEATGRKGGWLSRLSPFRRDRQE